MSKDNKDDDLVKNIRKYATTKRLNFLLGSGVSYPAIPLMGSIEGKSEEEKNGKLLEKVKLVSDKLVTNEFCNDTDIYYTLRMYREFILNIIGILHLSNSRQIPRTANIFTTNYDLFIEKATDKVLKNFKFVFNDGASGYFDRKLESTNYNRTVSYKGLNDNYTNELPSLTLIKPHGSVNWEKNEEFLYIRNHVIANPCVVKPTGREEEETFLSNHFHEMLRIFQLELDKPQTILFVIGFSFQDKHIAKMLKRALQNPELMTYIFAFDEVDKDKITSNLSHEVGQYNLNILILKIFRKIISKKMIKERNFSHRRLYN
ncbi:SIR2 family protein (plasmid) [Enterococcus faecium]